MSRIRSILAQMREHRRKNDTELMSVSEAQMGTDTDFTLETMMTGGTGTTTGANVRHMFLRRPDRLEEHTIQIEGILRGRFGVERPQARLIWAANQVALGDLHAVLSGLADDDLDCRVGLPDSRILTHIGSAGTCFRRVIRQSVA